MDKRREVSNEENGNSTSNKIAAGCNKVKPAHQVNLIVNYRSQSTSN
jgi:hypothetical protein